MISPAPEPPFVFLETGADPGAAGRLYHRPLRLITAHTPQDVPGALAALDAALAEGHHVAGFFSYELGYALEERIQPLMPPQPPAPLIWLGVFSGFEDVRLPVPDAPSALGVLQPAWDEAAYRRAFNAVKSYIVAGDVYQVDLTFPLAVSVTGDPLALYAALRVRQPVSHGAFIDSGDFHILSFSPERFFKVENGVISGRPMKGTAPRGATPEADAALAAELARNAKQRAENLMIVDLMRNDFGRLAETGSVRVTDLFSVETHATLHQMTSGVTARLKQGVGAAALIRNLFPCGSVVGAPKIRAMEIIRELESGPRGIYTGAIGAFAPAGAAGFTADFNVAIRTLWLQGGTGRMGVGSGVVADSIAADEYRECLLKARFLEPAAFSLIETLLWQRGEGFALLERHLERLRASAAHFSFPFHEAAIRAALDAAVRECAQSPARVRLTLAADGIPHCIADALAAAPKSWHYRISPHRLNPDDPFLYHKTTCRALYEDELRQARHEGFDEVIFFNLRDELCEGAISNLFYELQGRLYTPPLSCGLLPGTLRAELLATGKVAERVLPRADMAGLPLFAGNSVRGLIPLRM